MAAFLVLDVAVAVYAVDLILAVTRDEPGIRVAPYMRALLLVGYSSNMMAQIKLLGRILAEFVSIWSVIAMFLGFFAWFGNITFAGEEREQYFPNFVEACWSLLVMLTTANFPDVMIPAFTRRRTAGLLFFPLVVFGVFVLINFLLASTYDKYSNGHKELLETMLQLRESNCAMAFDMLVQEGESVVTAEVMEELLAEINVCSGAGPAELVRLRDDQRRLLFHLMDNNNDNGVSKSEFKAVITLLQLRFEKVSPVTFMQKWLPDVYRTSFWQGVCKVIRHPWFEYGVDAVLILNSVLLVLESAEALSGTPVAPNQGNGGAQVSDPWMEAEGNARRLNSCLGWVYMLEMLLKILVLGWNGYWSKIRNRFDGMITLGGVFTQLLLKTTSMSRIMDVKNLMVYFVTFRLLRVARLMVAVPQMRIIITTFGSIAPEACQFMSLLFVCMFTFCVLGVQLYGGLVSPDPDSELNKKISHTAYAEANYWALNFNDMGSGMALLFCLLVVNNWFLFVDMFVIASGGNRWHRWFFIAFYLFGVLVILNVVVAVVLENFILQWTARRNRAKEKMRFLESHANDDHEDGDGGRTATTPNGAQYKVRLASSVRMIEKDEVIRRFLNLEKHGDNAEPTEGDGNNDALGTSIRRILTFIRRTSISSLGLPRPGRASPSDHAGDSMGPTIDRIERLSGVDEDTMLLTANTLRGNGYSGHERNGSNDGAA
eukprot:jgi/Undpi1/12532/HiC_scaffold_6.g02201.m1